MNVKTFDAMCSCDVTVSHEVKIKGKVWLLPPELWKEEPTIPTLTSVYIVMLQRIVFFIFISVYISCIVIPLFCCILYCLRSH